MVDILLDVTLARIRILEMKTKRRRRRRRKKRRKRRRKSNSSKTNNKHRPRKNINGRTQTHRETVLVQLLTPALDSGTPHL